MLKQTIENSKSYQILQSFLPDDHSSQISSDQLLTNYLYKVSTIPVNFLDLGCGNAGTLNWVKQVHGNLNWYGLDIIDSLEANSENDIQNQNLANFQLYDGIHIPYEENTFDIIFSRQVFEHVRHPDLLMKEIYRVLKPQGVFIGSVAYLEPFHSYSIFNFTPFGVVQVLSEAGFSGIQIRPGVDGLTLLVRHMIKRPRRVFNFFLKNQSPLNSLFGLCGLIFGLNPKQSNLLKIQYSGSIVFLHINLQMLLKRFLLKNKYNFHYTIFLNPINIFLQ